MNSAYGPSDPSQPPIMDPSRGYANPSLSRLSSGSPPALPPYASIPPSVHSYQQHQQYQPPPPPPLPQPVVLQQLPHHQQHLIQPDSLLEQQQVLPHTQLAMHQHQPPSTYPLEGSPPPTDVTKDKDILPSQQMGVVSRAGDANGKRYSLDVVQQPKRARMCGYGDKDRRPITPPPCVRLIITDLATGKEINYKDIDHTMFVLNVDLWNEQGGQEVNLCRQPASTGAPSLAATPTYSYTTSSGGDLSSGYAPQMLSSGRDPQYGQPPNMGFMQDYNGLGYNQAAPSYTQNGGTYGAPQQYYPQDNMYSTNPNVMPIQTGRFDNGVPSIGYADNTGPSVAYVHDQYKGALNRNLIGSVAASAFCLVDTNDQEGIWFVLQDLSVRLEGTYRLKFSFVNVGMPSGPTRTGPSTIVRGKAPILAWCFSDSFNVYSAKKFPGVCESTALSKTFATQGIKIPIRKDGNKNGDDDDID